MAWGKVKAYYDTPTGLEWTPTSEEAGYEAVNLTDGLDVTWWRAATSADQDLIFDNGAAAISSFATSAFDGAAVNVRDVAFDPDGTLWVACIVTNKIYNIQLNGTLISSFLATVIDGSAANIQGITHDPNGTLWVCEATLKKIYNIEKDGTKITEFDSTVFDSNSTTMTAIDHVADGTLLIGDSSTDKIYNIEKDGTKITEFDTSDIDVNITNIQGLDSSCDGKTIYISDSDADEIFHATISGDFISSFPTSAFDVSSTAPTGIAILPDDTLSVCDSGSDRIYNIQQIPAFNYVAIGAGHNLNTIGAGVEVYYSDDAAAYTKIGQTIYPKDDKSFVIELDVTYTRRALKVKIVDASAAANVTLCYVGLKTELKHANLYDPQRRKRNQGINITEGGRLAGAFIRYTQREIDLKFKNADSDLYNKLDALWQNHGIKLFFLAWEPNNHSQEIYPVYIDDRDRNAPFTVSGELRKDGIKLKGLYE